MTPIMVSGSQGRNPVDDRGFFTEMLAMRRVDDQSCDRACAHADAGQGGAPFQHPRQNIAAGRRRAPCGSPFPCVRWLTR